MAGALGRLVEHDPRSRNFPAPVAETLVTTFHRRHSRVLDQGDLGSCTGNAMAGLLGTDPHYVSRAKPTRNERLAVELYSLATELDDVAGVYPPDDTGSTGLGVARAARQLGLIGGYAHAFGVDHVLGALVLGPVIVGVNWYDSFDVPTNGVVEIGVGAQVRGGHEFELVGLDMSVGRVRAVNSWGTGWGVRGRFEFSFDTLRRLLAEDGDCVTVQ